MSEKVIAEENECGTDAKPVKINTSIDELVKPLNAELQKELIITGSHAVKSPLTSLITGIQLLSCSKKDVSPNLHEIVNSLEKSVLGLKDLLLDIFNALKIANELNTEDIETINFPSIISTVQDRIKFKRNQILDISVAPDAINIRHNQRIIETALAALLENASFYSTEGTKIELQVEKINDKLSISVADEGTGIYQNEIKKICEPFYRSKMHKNNGLERTGLGLTIVNNIAKKFNGELIISSEQGRGSTFTLVLPIIPE